MNPYVLLLGLKPLTILTLNQTIFIQLNDPHHLANYILASPDGFSDFPLASITRYFEGGAKRDVMGRNENKMECIFGEGG